MSLPEISAAEVARHNSRLSCWVTISGIAYDLTDFLDNHPGGPGVILQVAGKDATSLFDLTHPPGTIQRYLHPDKYIGCVKQHPATTSPGQKGESPRNVVDPSLPPVSVWQNLDDIENVARHKLSPKAWAYFNSAADSLHSFKTNRDDWTKISFRPRVLRNVAKVSMKRNFMGIDSNLPFFIAPAAMAKLGHPDGELCLSRAAAEKNIPHCVSTYSSISHEELATCFSGQSSGGSLVFQLYLPRTNTLEGAFKLVKLARSIGCTALVITVDTPVVGKREEDERYKAQFEFEQGIQRPRFVVADGGEEPALREVHASTVVWDDIIQIKREWGIASGPVIIKGIQTAEDALKACEIGVDGIYLSNHGGRQLDFAPSSIRTLLEIRRFCPEVIEKVSIFMDGGVRRGTDIVKALCLGATAVGLGRPFMYALSASGTEGVLRAIQLLSEEIETTMRLLGVTNLAQLNEDYLNTVVLEQELPSSIKIRSSKI